MHNILLLSLIYPLPTRDNKGTSVCHFFTREWVKMGYNVRAVHVQAVYPHPFYWVAKLNAKRIAAKTGAVVYTKRLNHVEKYEMDNVPVMRVPVFKPIPHGKFSSRSVKKAVEIIENDCQEKCFVPDVIIGHFPNPQLEMVAMLKTKYPTAKTCIVMHGDEDLMKKVYGNRLSTLMSNIDMWGFRSKTIKEDFEKAVGKVDNGFICYSGIPESFLTHENKHDFSAPLRNFVYVGGLVDRKYPEKVVDALSQAYPSKDFTIKYIGDGQLSTVIEEKAKHYGLTDQVRLLGRIPREQIINEYDNADCMVMISKGEAYGLVYLEAMARGCITIASKREGFDGVIIDGENGFLCEAGNAEELASVFKRINCLTSKERQAVSERAIQTARRLTDEKAAKLYIDDIKARML